MFKEAIKSFISLNDQETEEKEMIIEYIHQYEDNLLYRENKFAHMTASGIVLNDAMDHMLMIHHNIYNTWAWTGGHADGESDLYEVAYQEVLEETGLKTIEPLTKKILSVDILPVLGHYKKGHFVGTHLHLNVTYVFIADMSSQLTIKADENSGVMWVPVESIDAYSNEPYLIGVYNKIIERALQVKGRL
ncbi:MAG: NUDIX hydrolase [Clostridiales bacterium]|nr:NUDIX hydrolase [Clostridiales bacterium]